jgi:RDD family
LSLVRQIAHYVDQLICYIGYLFPLWDDKRQTIADRLMSTVCVPLNAQPLPPQPQPQQY